MSSDSGEKPLAEGSGGVFERAFTRWFMRTVRIAAVTPLSEHFRYIDLQGESLREAAWEPGQKIQIKLDGGMLTRTYTPIHWNAVRGETRILAYAHGDGPGNDWVRGCAASTERFLLGPRRSIDLTGVAQRVVLFGDETSFGVAMVLQSHLTTRAVHLVFEVTSPSESGKVLEELGVESHLIARRVDAGHLTEVSHAIAPLIDDDTDFILTGKADSIQGVGRALKHAGVSARRVRAKVYWAPGKRGLD